MCKRFVNCLQIQTLHFLYYDEGKNMTFTIFYDILIPYNLNAFQEDF